MCAGLIHVLRTVGAIITGAVAGEEIFLVVPVGSTMWHAKFLRLKEIEDRTG
jgi:hypothetical protein